MVSKIKGNKFSQNIETYIVLTVFVSYCSGHPEYITYRSQFWAICSIALGPEIWQRSSLSEGRCSHPLYCDPLHSLWPVALTVTVALTMARCIISFCKSIAGPHLQKWRCSLCLTESLWVIHCFPCDKNLIHLSTLYMLFMHFCIIKGPVALGSAIWRRSSWCKGVARCTGTRNKTAFLIEQRW